jgi:hypothetical protein
MVRTRARPRPGGASREWGRSAAGQTDRRRHGARAPRRRPSILDSKDGPHLGLAFQQFDRVAGPSRACSSRGQNPAHLRDRCTASGTDPPTVEAPTEGRLQDSSWLASPNWLTADEWETVACIVRVRRGHEPSPTDAALAQLGPERRTSFLCWPGAAAGASRPSIGRERPRPPGGAMLAAISARGGRLEGQSWDCGPSGICQAPLRLPGTHVIDGSWRPAQQRALSRLLSPAPPRLAVLDCSSGRRRLQRRPRKPRSMKIRQFHYEGRGHRTSVTTKEWAQLVRGEPLNARARLTRSQSSGSGDLPTTMRRRHL